MSSAIPTIPFDRWSHEVNQLSPTPSAFPLHPGSDKSGVAYNIMEAVMLVINNYYENCQVKSIDNVNWIQCSSIHGETIDPLLFKIEDGQGIDIQAGQLKASCTTAEIDKDTLYKCEIETKDGDYSLKYTAETTLEVTKENTDGVTADKEQAKLSKSYINEQWVDKNGNTQKRSYNTRFFKKHENQWVDDKGNKYNRFLETKIFDPNILNRNAPNSKLFLPYLMKQQSSLPTWDNEKLGLLHAYLHAIKTSTLTPFNSPRVQRNYTDVPTPNPAPTSNSKAYLAVAGVVAAGAATTAWFFTRKGQEEKPILPTRVNRPRAVTPNLNQAHKM